MWYDLSNANIEYTHICLQINIWAIILILQTWKQLQRKLFFSQELLNCRIDIKAKLSGSEFYTLKDYITWCLYEIYTQNPGNYYSFFPPIFQIMKRSQKMINKIPYCHLIQAGFESMQLDKTIWVFNHCAILSLK